MTGRSTRFRRLRIVSRLSAALRLAVFGAVYVVYEILGLTALAALTLTGRRRDQVAHRRVQAWWTSSLLGHADRMLGVRILWPDVELPEHRFIILSRHSSPVDAALPAQWVTSRFGRPVHYVLKNQLRWDPCISLFGRRLGNAFIDRTDGDRSTATIREVALGAEPGAGFVLFPEGTYASDERRQRALARLERQGNTTALELGRALKHLLPPRPAGTIAALDAWPDADVVAIAPVGLEGLAGIGALCSRLPLRHPVVVRVRCFPRECIPDDDDGRRAWLNELWLSMDDVITRTQAVRSTGIDGTATDNPHRTSSSEDPWV